MPVVSRMRFLSSRLARARAPMATVTPVMTGAQGVGSAERQSATGGSAMVQKIAVGTDGTETASRAVEFAMDMAERYGAKLVIASAYRPVSETRLTGERDAAPADVQWAVNPSQEVDATLRDVEERAPERGLDYVSEARTGDPADVLVEIAGDQGVDVLIVGNRGMNRRILGSVPNSVSHHAPCSVLIVKTD